MRTLAEIAASGNCIVTRIELMRYFGIGEKLWARLLRDGAPARRRNGVWEVNIKEFLAFMIEDAIAASVTSDYAKAKAKDKATQAELRQLHYKNEAARLIDIDDARAVIAAVFSLVANRIKAIEVPTLSKEQSQQLRDVVGDATLELIIADDWMPKDWVSNQ